MLLLEYAYARRVKWEANMHAMALVETLAQVLMGKGSGILPDGRLYQEVSTEDGLHRMGIEL